VTKGKKEYQTKNKGHLYLFNAEKATQGAGHCEKKKGQRRHRLEKRRGKGIKKSET